MALLKAEDDALMEESWQVEVLFAVDVERLHLC